MTAPIRVAGVGYGPAVAPVVKSLLAHDAFALVARVDPDPLARTRFADRTGGTTYETAEPMPDAEGSSGHCVTRARRRTSDSRPTPHR